VKYFRHYIGASLFGTLATECEFDEKGLFWALLEMAGMSRNLGVIQANSHTPYTDERLCQLLNCTMELLHRSLTKFASQGRILWTNEGIEVIKWDEYQSDYYKKKGRAEKAKFKADEKVAKIISSEMTSRPTECPDCGRSRGGTNPQCNCDPVECAKCGRVKGGKHPTCECGE